MNIKFKNNKGEVIDLDSKLTIKELLKMGFTDFKIEAPDTPLLDGRWRSVEKEDK